MEMVSVLEETDSGQLRRGHSADGEAQSSDACKQSMSAAWWVVLHVSCLSE